LRKCRCEVDQEEESDGYAEHAVGDVEGGPVMFPPVEVEEIPDSSVVEGAVVKIAGDAGCEQCKCYLHNSVVDSSEDEDRQHDDQGDHGDGDEHGGAALCDAEGGAFVFPHDEAEESVDYLVFVLRNGFEPGEDRRFTDEIGGDTHDYNRPEDEVCGSVGPAGRCIDGCLRSGCYYLAI